VNHSLKVKVSSGYIESKQPFFKIATYTLVSPLCPPKEKGIQPIKLNPLLFLVRLAGFEPATYGLEVKTDP
jgi:hypothetical protein